VAMANREVLGAAKFVPEIRSGCCPQALRTSVADDDEVQLERDGNGDDG
jgi:hypothetical protein